MSDDGNSRLMIRISKAMPVLLRQFIGRRIGPILWQDMTSVIDFWFKNTILPMEYTIDAYQITINETNNPVEIQRRNQVKVLVEVRYQRAAKYIDVYNTALKNFFNNQSLSNTLIENYLNCWKRKSLSAALYKRVQRL